MKVNKSSVQLICDLERLIGGNCYNPNSLNGYTLEEGLEFRYPVCYKDENGTERKVRNKIVNLKPKDLTSVRYQFGSNHLYIGDAVLKLLNHLENEFGLDFNELIKNKKI